MVSKYLGLTSITKLHICIEGTENLEKSESRGQYCLNSKKKANIFLLQIEVVIITNWGARMPQSTFGWLITSSLPP